MSKTYEKGAPCLRSRFGAWHLGVALAALLHVGCTDQTDPFHCGEELKGASGVIRECSEAGQICVCETRSCAQKIKKESCRSGYQYLESPFVTKRGLDEVDRGTKDDPQSADLRCVPPDYLGEIIDEKSAVRACGATDTSSSGTGGRAGRRARAGPGGRAGRRARVEAAAEGPGEGR
ncbi:MAG: hypothetical protein R3B70_24540 [Polyangiaceae bacterium]